MKSLFIFRRDLRVEDNLALYEACKQSDEVICLFVLSVDQLKTSRKYFGYNSFIFMLETLYELKKQIPNMVIDYGDYHTIVKHVVKYYKLDNIFYNADYTPYSINRDELIKKALTHINFNVYHDLVLNNPANIKPYKVFTPYYNYAKTKKIANIKYHANISKVIKPKGMPSVNILSMINKIKSKASPLRQQGGRKNAETWLNNFVKSIDKYKKARDAVYMDTSRLSPYIKFGILSPREIFLKCKNSTFRKELYWRDFYIQISYYFPHVIIDDNSKIKKNTSYNISKNFKPMKILWINDMKLFKAWCDGKTQIPIVDAAMNQLHQTGYMHNRCRMIVSSVLTKLFHIDWRLGEEYFAKYLTDYDPSSNNGGWQWSSGTGADAQPYFRIFNPYTQAEKHDPNCIYIKKWQPQYSKLSPKEIFKIRSDLFNYEEDRALAIKIFKK